MVETEEPAPPPDPHALARQLITALDHIQSMLPPPAGGLGERLVAHLGADPRRLPGLVERLPGSERVNVQVALDELQGLRSRWELVGLPADIGSYGRTLGMSEP